MVSVRLLTASALACCCAYAVLSQARLTSLARQTRHPNFVLSLSTKFRPGVALLLPPSSPPPRLALRDAAPGSIVAVSPLRGEFPRLDAEGLLVDKEPDNLDFVVCL